MWCKNKKNPHKLEHAFKETRAKHQDLLVKTFETPQHARGQWDGPSWDTSQRQGLKTKGATRGDDERNVKARDTQVHNAKLYEII